MKRKYNIILANALIKNENRGCVALSYSSLYLIDKVLSKAGIDYSFYLPDTQNSQITYNKLEEKDIEINGKKIKYYPLAYSEGLTLRQKIVYSINKFLRRNPIYGASKIFQNADFILDIGQGDSFADIYGSERFARIDRIHRIAQKYHRPYCILPQTIGPFNDDIIKAKAIDSMCRADVVMARDKQSSEYVLELAPTVKVKEYIDLAFFLPYTRKKFSDNYIHVGLNVSGLLWHGGYTQDNQFQLNVDYKRIIGQILDFFLSQKNTMVHLVPHVVSGERYLENDYALSYDICEKYNNDRLILAPLFLDPIIAKSYISGLDFFMGARMHSTIAAFSSGVPVVPMAYSRKFNGLFEDTLDYHYMTDLKTQTTDEILSAIKDAFDKRSELKEIICYRMDTVVKEREQFMYEELRKFFKLV